MGDVGSSSTAEKARRKRLCQLMGLTPNGVSCTSWHNLFLRAFPAALLEPTSPMPRGLLINVWKPAIPANVLYAKVYNASIFIDFPPFFAPFSLPQFPNSLSYILSMVLAPVHLCVGKFKIPLFVQKTEFSFEATPYFDHF